MEFITQHTRQSSVKSLHLVDGSNTVGKSFINNKNKIASRTGPWGTPDVTVVWLEKQLSAVTFGDRPDINMSINCSIGPLPDTVESKFLGYLIKGLTKVKDDYIGLAARAPYWQQVIHDYKKLRFAWVPGSEPMLQLRQDTMPVLDPVPLKWFSNVIKLHWHNVNVNKMSTLLKLRPTNTGDIALTFSLGNGCFQTFHWTRLFSHTLLL